MAKALGLSRKIESVSHIDHDHDRQQNLKPEHSHRHDHKHHRADGHAKTHLAVAFSSQAEYAHLHVSHIGDDLMSRLTHELEMLQQFNLAVIHCDLPLNQPQAIPAIEQLEQLRFFWGAWLPEFNDEGDVLRLQRINRPIDTSSVVCARPEGEAIRDHVVAEWARVREAA